ncbi:hypothetical protein C5E22_03985 [Pectobacterium parmentieri]|uniref:Uncharacterized protein n=1 Tax=Pectobacterium parmentieri TaxID=1905730 RepID=A0A8B3FE08_PECPM|nr:hypothetical protein A8F97_00385 [Pectobacterium parmentieri]AYH02796.1 hypothetical protein C5E26_18635 [Pectobacterium parmentieri]AYH11584.1 hypothetical protein C5E24_18785 [Pectobacterium parmentieri]AYH17699.1 hypothetical protein C5E22_03985 [Pectobacterium parmentieri]AYH29056.1 hypothetical protein C5E20_18990 [Pectobacterium parmentieri]
MSFLRLNEIFSYHARIVQALSRSQHMKRLNVIGLAVLLAAILVVILCMKPITMYINNQADSSAKGQQFSIFSITINRN